MRHPVDIDYQVGDATRPDGEDPRIIAHICNDIGGWGSGFVLALSKRCATPEKSYRAWHREGLWEGDPFELGQMQLASYDTPGVLVANMVAQRGIRHSASAPPAVDYTALGSCLKQLGALARHMGASVHMPRIGCGLGGGDWNTVAALIEENLISQDVSVTVYDLPGTPV